MPVPSVPRRAAPPRKKPASGSLPTSVPEATQEQSDSSVTSPRLPTEAKVEEVQPIDRVQDTAPVAETEPPPDAEVVKGSKGQPDEVPQDAASPAAEENVEVESATALPQSQAEPSPTPPQEEALEEEVHEARPPAAVLHDVAEEEQEQEQEQEQGQGQGPAEAEAEAEEPTPAHTVSETPAEASAQQAAPEEEEEEDAAARRKRVAERLAKMGAFNPFAPPPRRQASSASTGEVHDVNAEPEVPVSLPSSPREQDNNSHAHALQTTVQSVPSLESPGGDETPELDVEDTEVEETQDGKY